MIMDQVGFRGSVVWDRTKPNGQPRRCLDVTRAEREFGFRARFGLREGIAKTLEWFLAHRGEAERAALA
jgi:GDP-L-fucose synthase